MHIHNKPSGQWKGLPEKTEEELQRQLEQDIDDAHDLEIDLSL